MKPETNTETYAAINTMAARTAESIDLIEGMALALIAERPDLKEMVDRQLHAIKEGLVEQFFATAFFDEPEPEPPEEE